MANTFYDPGEQRAAKVHELFARIAPRYDLINDLQSFGLHRHWKRRVIQLARPSPASGRWTCAAARATLRWGWPGGV